MASVYFEPLYGFDESGPVSSVLEIDGFRILLDCGWNELFDVSLLNPLKEYVFAFNSFSLLK
jgi:cleavage and polyadenylation specificity factor subunit 2